MLDFIVSALLLHWPIAILLVIIAWLATNHFNKSLRKYPGPFLASLTDWWRFFDVLGRRPDITHNALHKKHGNIVRYGPNALSFADPKALKDIYGLNKGFIKVNRTQSSYTITYSWLKQMNSLDSILSNKRCRKASVCLRSFPPPTSNITPNYDEASMVLSR